MTIRINHNRSTALERSEINYFGGVCVGGGVLNLFYAQATPAKCIKSHQNWLKTPTFLIFAQILSQAEDFCF